MSFHPDEEDEENNSNDRRRTRRREISTGKDVMNDEEYENEINNIKRGKGEHSENYYEDLISQMPRDIRGEFAENLSYADILVLCQLSKRFSKFCKTEYMEKLIKRKFEESPDMMRLKEARKRLRELIDYELSSGSVSYIQSVDLSEGEKWSFDAYKVLIKIIRYKISDDDDDCELMGSEHFHVDVLLGDEIQIMTKSETIDFVLEYLKKKSHGTYLYNFRPQGFSAIHNIFVRGTHSLRMFPSLHKKQKNE